LLEGAPVERPPLLQLLQQAVPLLLADLEAQGQALDEQLYLQLARVAGIMGDPDKVRILYVCQACTSDVFCAE
jgi:predicted component of type VI protein secretion system